MSPVSRALENVNIREVIVHTGQHYSHNLSDIFFKDLQLPVPHYHIDIQGRTLHGEMTGKILEETEKILLKEHPDLVLVYGDTNSTLAGALAAVKLQIPVAHVEAGVRIGNIHTPEEANRTMVSRIAQFHFCCTLHNVQTLAKEDIVQNVFLTGDVMRDAFIHFSTLAEEKSSFIRDHDLEKKSLVLATFHRPENVDFERGLHALLLLLTEVSREATIVFPIHPRTQKKFQQFGLWDKLKDYPKILTVDPISYLDTLAILAKTKYVITDSGGLQREAFFAGKFSFFFFDQHCWPEIQEAGWQEKCDCLTRWDAKSFSTFHRQTQGNPPVRIFGDGYAAEHIVSILTEKFK
jgi:UDP-N-acetylglucosamine 2-epimerase